VGQHDRALGLLDHRKGRQHAAQQVNLGEQFRR